MTDETRDRMFNDWRLAWDYETHGSSITLRDAWNAAWDYQQQEVDRLHTGDNLKAIVDMDTNALMSQCAEMAKEIERLRGELRDGEKGQ